METALKLWTVIFAVGALNYLSRLSFIALFARRTMPPLLARALKYVPAAMLTALILPMVIDWHGVPADFATPRVAAALIATAVAFATRSTLATLGAGMAALWLLQWMCAC
jgi:branched-subunit amino acid transport protein